MKGHDSNNEQKLFTSLASKLNEYRSNSNGRLSYATKQMRITIIVSPSKEMHILKQRRVQKWLGCTINHNNWKNWIKSIVRLF